MYIVKYLCNDYCEILFFVSICIKLKVTFNKLKISVVNFFDENVVRYVNLWNEL